MKRFIQGEHRGQGTLLPESLDDYVSDTNPVRVVDVFVVAKTAEQILLRRSDQIRSSVKARVAKLSAMITISVWCTTSALTTPSLLGRSRVAHASSTKVQR